MHYGLEQMEAEDVAIEVFHYIWEIRKSIKSPAALHSLLFVAVKHRAINVNRNIKNHERIIGEQHKEGDDKFYDYLMEEKMSRLLDEAIEALPPHCRQVVLLLLSGKSISEIAVLLDISNSSVKTYKSRAIEILRGSLQENPFLLGLITFILK